MSVFSVIGNFFKHIFQKLRPGIDDFLKKYEGLGVSIVANLALVHDGKGLREWEDQAFDAIKAEVAKDVKDIKDNWISILVKLSYEELKAKDSK